MLLVAAAAWGIAGEARAQALDPCGPGSPRPAALAGDTAPSRAVADHAGDRAALVALYAAAGGPYWKDATNWLSGRPLDTWYGVRTEGGRVTKLDLCGPGGNNLRGTIPPALGKLSKLRDLRLSNNFLTGTIPAALGELTELEVLRLSNNALRGTVPAVLAKLPDLDELRLHRNQLTGDLPEGLRHLPDLRRLRIEDNAGLCAPDEAAFRAWLRTLDEFRGDCAAAVPALPLPAALALALLLLGGARRRSRGPRA